MRSVPPPDRSLLSSSSPPPAIPPLLLLPPPSCTAARAVCAGDRGSTEMSSRSGFYRQELNKTVWEVPERYQHLTPVGSGAYGSVW